MVSAYPRPIKMMFDRRLLIISAPAIVYAFGGKITHIRFSVLYFHWFKKEYPEIWNNRITRKQYLRYRSIANHVILNMK